ncbi:MAG: hypothetical protein H6577_26415 [Lewinellaceae bacterium]|nr:hypothetical protein [Saprospiraceae bacterium]MCB9341675.1 hypothetical protein [Lewinellaceae bacterium]
MKKPRRPRPVIDLPSPDEVNAAAAELSETVAPAKKSPPPIEGKTAKNTAARKNLKEAPAPTIVTKAAVDEAKAVGRPRANHGRRSTSVMVRPQIWKQLKLLALQRDIDLSEMLENMFLDYINNKK